MTDLLVYERSFNSMSQNLSGKSASLGVGHEPLEGGPGARVRFGVAQHAMQMVIAESDGGDVEGELLHIEVRPILAGLDRHAGRLGDEREAPPVGLLEEVALRSGAVVEFHGRGDQQAAAGHRRIVLPGEPVFEHGPDARLPPGGGERRVDHRLLEPLDGCLEHLELELVLGPEVGEQAALREPQLGREGTDRQPLQAIPAGQPDGLVEDAFAGLGSLPHEEENYTNDRSIPSRTARPRPSSPRPSSPGPPPTLPGRRGRPSAGCHRRCGARPRPYENRSQLYLEAPLSPAGVGGGMGERGWGVRGLKTKDPGTFRQPGSQGSFRWRWVPLPGHPPVPRTRGGSPYEDATSMEPCLPSITGPPPSWAYPSSAGPNPPGPVGRPSRLEPPRHSREEAWTLDTTICWGRNSQKSTAKSPVLKLI